jgi:hypothetical protein
MKLLWIISAVFDVTDQILINLFITYWRRKWEYNGTVHQLFVDLKKAYDSVGRGVFCSFLTEFGAPIS